MGIVFNKFVVAVPQQYSFVVEFLGKYQKTLNPGLNLLIPLIQRVAYKHSLKEQSFQIKAQNAVTKDNVIMQVDGVLYMRVDDPVKCSYGAKDPISYTSILAQSIMRSEIGSLTLDQTFEERESINKKILENLNLAAEAWGLKCLRYEIKDIKVSDTIKKVMNLQAESERKKRAEILLSEGRQTSDVNMAEAIKRGSILKAQGQSEQIILKSKAINKRLNYLQEALIDDKALIAAKFMIAQKYLNSLSSLADPKKNIVIQQNLSQPDDLMNQSMTFMDKQIDIQTPSQAVKNDSSKQ